VPDIHQTTLSPFKGLTYNDKPTGTVQKQEQDHVTITGETDRVYHSAPAELIIHTPKDSTFISKTNFNDAVVWNAWSELSKTIADLGPNEWQGYVCCEVGIVINPTKLSPGQKWEGSQTITRQVK